MNRHSKAIKDFGGEGEVIILLHGFLASSKYWRRLQPYLTQAGYRVITMDLLGFGRAPKPKISRYTYEEYIQYIDENIKFLKLKKPFTLVGHSMGALLAARYSLRHSNKVKTLILLHPPLYKNTQEAEEALRNTGKFYRFLLDSRFRSLGWALIRVFSLYHISRHNKASRERSFKNIISAAEMSNDLKKIRTQTLLLVGLLDRVQYQNNLKSISLSPYIKVVYERVSHHSPLLRPKLIAAVIVGFIK